MFVSAWYNYCQLAARYFGSVDLALVFGVQGWLYGGVDLKDLTDSE